MDAPENPDGTEPESAESVHMDQVDRVEWGPTEADEMEVLSALYEYDEETGTFLSHVGDED